MSDTQWNVICGGIVALILLVFAVTFFVLPSPAKACGGADKVRQVIPGYKAADRALCADGTLRYVRISFWQ